ncbi:hypothetical protein K470DRAFT_268841 [Piedraia hortae CBS 480.64]|uniref:F-box domain-containing protein n=1 Tax=Piedraia hortae CBS 480.64 TaxID=1314780 RepID=A0A6A7C4R6_9PEZI|nr:hypothetical protein K470DRAFT_268841 [Piedraia hortae CBS 480.64]
MHLLRLPPELRNMVYRCIFPVCCPSQRLIFLLVCRQMYKEAHLLAFSCCKFLMFLCDPTPASDDRAVIPEYETAKALRHFTFAFPGMYRVHTLLRRWIAVRFRR